MYLAKPYMNNNCLCLMEWHQCIIHTSSSQKVGVCPASTWGLKFSLTTCICSTHINRIANLPIEKIHKGERGPSAQNQQQIEKKVSFGRELWTLCN